MLISENTVQNLVVGRSRLGHKYHEKPARTPRLLSSGSQILGLRVLGLKGDTLMATFHFHGVLG